MKTLKKYFFAASDIFIQQQVLLALTIINPLMSAGNKNVTHT